jgi:hypothetical protein
MEKLQNVVLFTAAIFSALALFAIGKRYIVTSANSRRAQKFLLYTSAVLVFLCGTAGFLRLNTGATVYAQEQEKKKPLTDTNLARCAGWQRIRSFTDATIRRLRLREKLDERALERFKSELEERLADAQELKKSRRISEPVRFYVETVLNDLAWVTENAAADKQPTRRKLVKRFVFQLRLHRDLTRFLNGTGRLADSGRPEQLKDVFSKRPVKRSDISLAAQIKTTIQVAFDMVKGVPFASRLSNGSVSRSAYRSLLTNLSDEVYEFIARSRPQIRREPAPDPGPVPEYGIRPLYGVRPPRPPRKPRPPVPAGPTVVSLEGRLKVRRPGGVWRGVTSGTTITRASVVENTLNKKDVVKFSNGPAATLEPREVVAGWELYVETPPELLERSARLIRELAAEDEVRTRAMNQLRRMGLSVWPPLQETAFCDVERRAQAATQLLRELVRRHGADGGRLTVDDLSLTSTAVLVEPVPQPPTTKYGVRPRR